MLQHLHDWSMYFCSFSINFILNSLLHFLKLFQLCSLLIPQNFLALHHVLPSPRGQVPATSQPPQTMAFCRWLHDHTNVAQSCYSKQSCFLVLICEELVLFLSARSHVWEVCSPGTVQFPVIVQRMKYGSLSLCSIFLIHKPINGLMPCLLFDAWLMFVDRNTHLCFCLK